MSEAWVRPRPDAASYRGDAIAATLVAAGTIVSLFLHDRVGYFDEPAPGWLSALAIAVLTVPLAFRRRYPATVAILVSIGFFVALQFSVPELLFINIALFMAIYTLGAWGQNRRVANLVRVAIILGMFVWIAVNLIITVSDPELMPEVSRSGLFSQFASVATIQIITNILYFGGAYYFGNAMYASARQRADLEARTTELAQEREHSAAQAVALDRVNIARELHDVVAHHVSVMGVQAGAARRVIQSNPAQASESLELIERSAREAVDELHRLLTTLRSTESDAASQSSSTLGVDQLAALAESTTTAGVPTRFQVIGEPREVTTLAGFTLYRIAQEALTNVRKHAGPDATADVRLRYEPDRVELEIVDTGTGHGTGNGRGLGLVGMRERIAAAGGELEVGPRMRGGYLVRASVPTTVADTAAVTG
ncbi:sensor histidine kinase [Homoserinimonas sp. A520]